MQTENSARRLPPARLAGLLSLMTLGFGIYGEFFVLGSMIVPGDAAATAERILNAETLFRLGYAANMVDYACYVGVSVILFLLLRPINEGAALFSLVASIIATAIVVINSLFGYSPLVLLKSGAADAELWSMAALRLRGVGANVGLLFFGLHLLFVGLVLARATFLPRFLSWLLMLGGLCFAINCIASLVAPPIASQLQPYILAPGILAQASLALWLLIMGVNATKWREQAARA